jgi:hypothetical protein
MVRLLAAAIVLSCFSTSAWAQAQPAPPAAGTQPVTPTVKPAIRKPAARGESAGKPVIAKSGPCGLGVIVSVGDEFMVAKIGLTIFQNNEKVVPIESWGLNDLVFARVRAAAPPGVTVLRIPYSKAAFPPREETKNQWFRDERAELVDLMRRITNGTNCQRYVLVSKSISKFNDLNWTVRGIGIVDHDVPLRRRTYLFALSYIRVFDGRDFSIIRQGSALTHLDPLVKRMLLGTLILGPYSELAEASFPNNPEEAAKNLALREYARALLTTSLDKTLPFMLQSDHGQSEGRAK